MTCCDENEPIYWDAVPCGIDSYYRYGCVENSQCQFNDRKYISLGSYCDGTDVKICECQRFAINRIDQINTLSVSDIFTIEYIPSTSGPGIIDWSDTEIEIQDPDNGTITIANTGTVEQVFNYIDSIPNWGGILNTNIDNDLPATIIQEGIYNFNPSDSLEFDSKDSKFKLKLGTLETSYINYNSDANTLANSIQSALRLLPGYDGNVDVSWNDNFSTSLINYFEIVFKNDQCGVAQSGVSGSVLNINYNHGYYSITDPPYLSAMSGEYGNDPSNGIRDYLNDPQYLRLGSGDFSSELYGNFCPYGVLNITDASDDLGPYPYDGTQCCPQKGITYHKGQSIYPQLDNTSGYNRNDKYSNLENTLIINNDCYKVDPFYFMFGRAGRFNRSHETTRTPLITPNCDFSKSTEDGGCANTLPSNCAVDLFLAQFNQNIPWGPFGSYFHGIEDQPHPATEIDGSYISINDPGRIGIDYAPIGTIKTYGEWLSTKEIHISFSFHRAVPYWMGSGDADDINLLGTIDESTIDANFDFDSGSGCGLCTLIYYTSGKTVGDFLTAVNNVKTAPTGINETGCNVFAFCPSSNDVLNIPCDKIINTSSELYDLSEIFGVSDGIYDASIDSNKLSGSDIIGSPKPYSKLWPKVSTNNIDIIGGASSDTDGVYARLYNTTNNTDNPMAKYPPYCRLRAIGLPKSTDNTTIRPNRLFAGPNFTDNFGFKSPWWQGIQGANTNVVNLAIGSGIPTFPSYITRVDVDVTDRVLNIVVNSGSDVIFTTGINTIKNSGYTVVNFVDEINRMGFNSGGYTIWPVSATSGVTEYDIWLDDATYWDSSTHEPLNSGDVGAVETPYNFGYVEPIQDVESTNLISTSSLNLYSFIRRRCDYGEDESNTLLPPMTGCVPYNATKFNISSRFDCDSDTIKDNNDYILVYGCASFVCRTEWYLKATRCGCSTEWKCTVDSGKYVAHRFNLEGNSNDNQNDIWNGLFSVNQPILYLCEYALHSQCDIPFLIKTPYQIWGDVATFPTNDDGIGFECGNSDIAIVYADSSHVDAEAEYLGSGPSCPILDTYSLGATTRFLSECEGWCQYIDPVTAERVKKEDIPRTWPPTAYIAERGYPSFCSINPFSESIEDICNGTFPQYNWDSIYGVLPAVPAEYTRQDNGMPCTIWPNYSSNGLYGLRVLTRPIINTLTHDDLCGNADESRIDIGCATKCCGCFFDCSSSDNTLKYGPKACPCYQTYSFDQTVTTEDLPYLCSFIHRGGLGSIQPCNQCITYEGGGNSQPNIYGGTYDIGYTINFEYSVDICCRICPVGFSTTKTYTYSRDVTGCVGDYYDGCNGDPSVTPPDVACNSSGPCAASSDEVIGCPTLLDLIETTYNTEVHTHTTGINVRDAYTCGGSCVYNLCGRFSDFEEITDVTIDNTYCQEVSRSWDYTFSNIAQGTSPYDSVNLGYSRDGGSTLFQFTTVTHDVGSINIGAKSCADCPVGLTLPGIAKSLAYVTGWINNVNYICGESNLAKIYTLAQATGYYLPNCS